MPDDKKKPLQELDLAEGLVCDPETGICEIPGTGGQKPENLQRPPDKATREGGER